MAITREDLQVKVELDSKDVERDTAKLVKGIDSLDESLDKANKRTKLYEKALIKAKDQIDLVNKSTEKVIKATAGVAPAIENAESSFSALEVTLLGVVSTISAGGILSSFKEIGKSSTVVTSLLSKMGAAFDSVFSKVGAAVSGVKSKLSNFAKATKGGAGLITIAEASNLATPALFALAGVLRESENAAARFVGQMALVGAILLGSFAAAMNIALRLVGDLVIGIGDRLIEAMAGFEKQALKTQQIVSQFEFTVQGFNRTFGESVGTLEQWESVVSDISDTSTLAFNDITKSVKLVIAEGTALGLNFEQSMLLVKRATDIASASGNNLTDTMQKLLSALTGNSQAALSLGIDTRKASLAHTEFIEKSGVLVDNLDDQEIVMARLAAIFERTTPIIGAAASEIETTAGAAEILDRSLNRLEARIGEQSKLTTAYFIALNSITEAFVDLPDPILDAVGATQDFLGVTLKVTGVVLKYTLTITGLITVFKLLQSAIASSLFIQGSLTAAFTKVAGILGTQAIAVTSLKTAFVNLGIVTKGTVLTGFKSLAGVIGTTTKAIIANTAALLRNPLFLKAAAIASLVLVLFKAFKQVNDETKLLTRSMDILTGIFKDITEAGGPLSSLIETLASIFSKVFSVAVQGSTVILAGFLSALAKGSAALLKLASFIPGLSDSIKDGLNRAVDEAIKLGDDLAATAVKAGVALTSAFVGVAKASEASKVKVDDFKKTLEGIEDIELKPEVDDSELKELEALLERLDSIFKRETVLNVRSDLQKIEGVDTPDAFADRLGLQKELLTLPIKSEIEELEVIFKETGRAEVQEAIDSLDRQMGLIESGVDFRAAAKSMEEVKKKSDALAQSIMFSNLSRAQQAEVLTQKELEKVDLQRESLKAAGLLTEERAKELDVLDALIAKQGELNVAKAVEADKKDDEKDAKKAADEGFAASLGQVSTALSAVDGIVSGIPGAIDQAAGIVNKITDLPTVVLESINGLGRAFDNFADNFVSNLAENLPKIIKSLVKTFVRFAIIQLPKLIIELIKAIPQLIGDIFKGIFEGFTEIDQPAPHPMVEDDQMAKNIEKSALKAGKAIEGSNSKLFAVTEANAAAAGVATSDKIRDAISSSTAQGADRLGNAFNDGKSKMDSSFGIFSGLIEILDTIWKFASDLLIPFITLFEELWKGFIGPLLGELLKLATDILGPAINILSDLLKSILEPVTKILNTLLTTILKPVTDILARLFDDVLGPVIKLLSGVITKVLDGIVAPLAEVFGELLGAIFEVLEPVIGALTIVFDSLMVVLEPFIDIIGGFIDVVMVVLEPIIKVFSKIISFAVDNFIKPLVKGIKEIADFFGGFIESLKKLFDELFGFFGDIGEGVGDFFSDAGEGIADFFGFADGGRVPHLAAGGFPVQGTDTVPSMLTPGEFVLNKDAAASLGTQNLNTLNRGRLPVTQQAAGTTIVNVDMTINNRGDLSESEIKNKIMPRVKDEFKRASLNGSFVISKKGIR